MGVYLGIDPMLVRFSILFYLMFRFFIVNCDSQINKVSLSCFNIFNFYGVNRKKLKSKIQNAERIKKVFIKKDSGASVFL